MAEGAVLKMLLETVKKLIMDEADLLLGVKGHIYKLQNELEWMNISIRNAEADETLCLRSDEKLKLWVKQVRGIVFDTEDVIDEFILEIVHCKQFQMDPEALKDGLKGHISSAKQLPSLHKYGNRIKKINTRLNDLQANRERYWFVSAQATGGGTGSSSYYGSSLSLQQKIERRRAEIAAEECHSAIIIHEESMRQVKSLLLTGDAKDEKLRIISIVGMGGVGKTTLSKKVYNDGIVAEIFKYRAFVYISKVYNLQELIRSIIMQCSNSTSVEEELPKEKLLAFLKGKKYLIVLDDVWDTDALNKLRSALPEEENGSRVLLTTRHKVVANHASGSSSPNIHKLWLIEEPESWKLFLTKVFPLNSFDTSDQIARSMKVWDLGKQMVEKCCGLPLAIVVLGSLLLGLEKCQNEWRKVNDRASWYLSQGDCDHSLICSGILALSYDYLPYYLKPCFLYMSLFPENSEICATKLFQCWIAEGFVSKRGDESLEDTAEDYLEELIGRSLIQVSKLRCDGIRVKTCCIHNLLREISVTECKGNQFSQIYGSIDTFYRKQEESRRVAVYCNPRESDVQYTSKIHYIQIRSLMCQGVLITKKNFLSSLFGSFRLLRVLEFHGDAKSCCVSFPEEVGKLIHLRYLNLEKTKLNNIDTGCLSKLVNLEFLNLNGCVSELKLDDRIWRLQHLRYLNLDGINPTASKRRTTKLGIDNLTNLQFLIIVAGDWMNGGGLKRLTSLRKLRIEECLSSRSDEIADAVANFTKLQSLTLTSKISLSPLTSEGLPLASIQFSNHESLKRLHLKGNIHGWTGSISFPPNLCKLKLEWSSIKEDPMPILEKFPCLIFLHLGFNSYEGNQMVCLGGGFGCLRTLEIFSLEKLQIWIIEEGALKILAHLEIRECRRLKMIPDGLQQLTTLKHMRLDNMPLQFQSRTTKEAGEDWNKIKHIPSLIVSGF